MPDNTGAEDLPLGVARAQLHENYIVSQTSQGLVIVDQHAAHERLVYERLKRQMAEHGVKRQGLLIPEVVDLGADAAGRVLERAEELAELGLVIEPFGGGAVAVREVPAVLGQADPAGLIRAKMDVRLGIRGAVFKLNFSLMNVCLPLQSGEWTRRP